MDSSNSISGLQNRVCISVYGETVSVLRANVNRALKLEPAYVELRLDYLRDFFGSLPGLSNIKRDRRLIFTFRARFEGGVSRVSDKLSKQILLQLLSTVGPPTVDIELKTLEQFPELLDSVSDRSDTRLIVSSHNFAGTENKSNLEELVLSSVRKYTPAIVKIVRQANAFDDNLTLLSLYRLSGSISPTKLIAFCSGSLGIYSRIVCVSYGSPFTFASLPGRTTAPGQFDFESISSLLDSWGAK